MFAAAETVINLTQSEATNESVTITWDPPAPLNSVVGYAVLACPGLSCKLIEKIMKM